ncbi:MAG: hypothetical protein WBB74_11305 [Gaiellaceae bacterium]
MTDFDQLLNRRRVRLDRPEAYELAQKLRARGGTETAARLLEKLEDDAQVIALGRDEARALLDELRASGRAWVGGTGRLERPTPRVEEQKRGLRVRLWRRR